MAEDDSSLRTRSSLLLRLREEPDNQAAWGEFVDRYGPQIFAWCRHWGLQTADADDVTQTVLLKLATHLRGFKYDPARRFRGFLMTLTQHAWSDFIESQQRAVRGSGDSAVAASLNTVEARDDLATRLGEAFDQELVAIASLRVRQRIESHTWEAFRLTALEGKSGAETAAALGIQVGTVFKAKSKVQKMLREELERLENEEASCLAAPTGKSSSGS
jgi:RNA polymerase sigma factor (sigma-70 family)